MNADRVDHRIARVIPRRMYLIGACGRCKIDAAAQPTARESRADQQWHIETGRWAQGVDQSVPLVLRQCRDPIVIGIPEYEPELAILVHGCGDRGCDW